MKTHLRTPQFPGPVGPYPEAGFSKAKSAATIFRAGGVAAAVSRVAKRLWPSKADIELAIRTGASDRACRNWLAARCNLSADALAALLCSREGLVILDQIFASAPNGAPEWWRALRRAQETEIVSQKLDALGARIAAARRGAAR